MVSLKQIQRNQIIKTKGIGMAKTIQKPIFTEDLAKYRHFLEAADINLEASISTIVKEIETHKRLRDLIDIYQKNKELDPEKMSSLIKGSCPDFVSLAAFENLDSATSIESIFAEAEASNAIFNCTSVSCETCWKNYINHMARLLNNSMLDIKSYDPEDDGDGN